MRPFRLPGFGADSGFGLGFASLALFSLLGTAACDSLWGGFRDPYAGNCVSDPASCPADHYCNRQTRVCQPPDLGSSADLRSGVDLSAPSWCSPSGGNCSPEGVCGETVFAEAENVLAVGGVRGDLAWAVGSAGTIFKRDAAGWQQQVPQSGKMLFGVWGNGSDSAWAVGNAGFILNWNGSSWINQTGVTVNTLYGLWGSAADNVWAVGASDAVARWDGSSWSSIPFNFVRQLRGVWTLDAKSTWVIGDTESIYQYNGSWKSVHTGARVLRGIWGTDAGNIWAVGTQGLILHYDGTDWTAQTSGTSKQLNAVAGCDKTNVWVVGEEGTILKLQGQTWTTIKSANALSSLSGVFAFNSSCGCHAYIAGSNGVIFTN